MSVGSPGGPAQQPFTDQDGKPLQFVHPDVAIIYMVNRTTALMEERQEIERKLKALSKRQNEIQNEILSLQAPFSKGQVTVVVEGQPLVFNPPTPAAVTRATLTPPPIIPGTPPANTPPPSPPTPQTP